MKVKIKIAEVELSIENWKIDEQWINQQIERRRRDGQSVCVIVTVQDIDVSLHLFTPTCDPSGGGSTEASLSSKEKKIIELWERRGLRRMDFSEGDVISFLKQLQQLF